MKKKLLVLLLIVALLPTKVFAKSIISDYQTMGLKETVEAEGLVLENKNYKETDNQAIIYLFRGQGCSHCHEFVEFLNSISTEYGQYFKLVSFEVWKNSDNHKFFQKIATFEGDNPNNIGVPYFIIGDKLFNMGYGSSMAEEVKSAIMSQYKDNSYDVMKEYEKSLNGNNSGNNTIAIIFWNAFIVVAATVAIIVVNNNNTKKVLDAMNNKVTKKQEK